MGQIRRRKWPFVGAAVILAAAALTSLCFVGQGQARSASEESGGAAVSSKWLASAEIYDPKSGRFTHAGDISIETQPQSATELKDGTVLVIGASSAAVYDPATGRFSKVGEMITAPRYSYTATLLRDGKVLIAGGDNPSKPPRASELYDPARRRFFPAADLIAPRATHSAVLLHDGRVLLAGGWDPEQGQDHVLKSAELYDPRANRFEATGSMLRGTAEAKAVTLRDGRILFLGGHSGGFFPAPIDYYNPGTGRFHLARAIKMDYGFDCSVTPLAAGRILLTGCLGSDWSTRLYDPSTGEMMPDGRLVPMRVGATATLLQDGRVLVAGGTPLLAVRRLRPPSPPPKPMAIAEIYDPATGKFTPTGSMTTPHSAAVAVRLRDERVLIIGGEPQ